ncbi:hypothetical protein [Aquabacterium sp.]|uniref:hypothetical protein n=1 Tax=Aquabacterium sp. TaxID=1872578 RepID=UPI002D12DD78|nr:hypothetical protein [Aquabacterium sp.]HSW07338.1 hypothetical protein [Aquabacterium sp.]
MAASPVTPLPGDGSAGFAAPAGAQLLIHAALAPPVRDGVLERLLLLLRSLTADGRRRQPTLPTDLRIDDLQGRRCFAADSTHALIAVHLPAGTYHVSARLGPVLRRYTVTLERGASFDLYLRLASERH